MIQQSNPNNNTEEGVSTRKVPGCLATRGMGSKLPSSQRRESPIVNPVVGVGSITTNQTQTRSSLVPQW